MTPNTPSGDGAYLRNAYAMPADMAGFLAERLANTLVIIRLERTLLQTPDPESQTPHIHTALEHIVRLLPNRAVVAQAPKPRIIACLTRAGILSDFHERCIFGTEGLTIDAINRGHLYLQAVQQLGFFRSNVLVIESTDSGMNEVKYAGLKPLRFLSNNPQNLPDTFTSLTEFGKLIAR